MTTHKGFLSLALLVCLTGAAHGQATGAAQPAAVLTAAPADTAYRSDPKFQKALADGSQMLRNRQATFAVDAFKKAFKLSDGHCLECAIELYSAQMADGRYKDALATAQAWSTLETTPKGKSAAASGRGRAIMAQAGEKPRPEQLEAAHAAFQESIAAYPRNPAALYQDGHVLALLGKMEEARAIFKQCVSCTGPNDPARLRAEHFAEDPELSLHKMAPSFEVTALDGSKFNLDAMNGRVVLIDFWATWCGPCNEELPHMQKIAKEFAEQPLVIISVSWDRDETAWKQFIARHNMTWVQYRDADHKLSDNFSVNAIPHYFTIDSDGVLTAEMLGEGSDVEGKLKKLLAKARAAKDAQSPASDTLQTHTAGN